VLVNRRFSGKKVVPTWGTMVHRCLIHPSVIMVDKTMNASRDVSEKDQQFRASLWSTAGERPDQRLTDFLNREYANGWRFVSNMPLGNGENPEMNLLVMERRDNESSPVETPATSSDEDVDN
jgi:hypothetical protein